MCAPIVFFQLVGDPSPPLPTYVDIDVVNMIK